MKTTLKFLPVIMGLIFVSCAKTEIESTPTPQEGPRMKVTMTSVETKTAMVQGEGNTFSPKWTAGDQLGVFVRANGANVDTNISTEALEADAESATFTAEVTAPENDGTYDFYTYYPYNNLEDSDYKAVRVAIPSEQHPANSSFDPKADILTGYPKAVEVTAGQTELEGLSIQFLRKSSIVRFLIPSCTGFDGIDGETTVSEVTVYFDKNVTGVAKWDITEMDDLTLEEAGASNAVTLKYTEAHKITDPLWLSIAPVSGVKRLTFAFKVADNAYLYAEANLPGDGATFAAGGMKKYDIPINATSWSLKSFTNKYVKVTETPASWLGKYLIVGENESTLYACDQSGFGSWGKCSAVTAEDDESISGNATINGYAFEVVNGTANGTYAFKTTDGKYLSSGAVKNCNVEESQSATKTDFILTCADEGLVTVKSNNESGRYLRYNHNSGSGGLRFYDGTTGVGISLYKQVEDYSEIAPVIADPVGIPDEVAKEGVTDATFTVGIANLSKYSVSIPAEGGVDGTVVTAASVSYADGTATVTYSVAANTGADRDGWIKLQAGTTEKKIEIHQATGIVLPEITTVEDQNISYEASDSRTFDVTITNVGSFEVTCETDGTVVTAASAALKEGDIYTVTYTVTENTGMESRDGKVTVNCSTVSSDVKIIQGINTAAIKTYRRVANVNAIVPGTYIIIASTSTITSYLDNAKVTDSAPQVKTSGFSIDANDILTTSDDSGMAWNFTGTTSKMTIKSEGGNFLYVNGSNNNGLRVGGTSDTWSISKHGSNEGDNLFQFKDENNSRFFGIYNNADWRSYTTYNATNYTNENGSSKIKLYLLDDGKMDYNLNFWNAAAEETISDLYVNFAEGSISYIKLRDGESIVSASTYESSDTDVATVDNSGTVTLKKKGDATITATLDGDATHKTTSVSYTLHVSNELSSIALAEDSEQPTEFYVGDDFNYSGIKIKVTYNDGEEKTLEAKDLTADNFSGFNSTEAVESQEITVSYTENDIEKTCTYTVKIKASVTRYDITVPGVDANGNSVTVKNGIDKAAEGDKITLVVSPATNYYVTSIKVNGGEELKDQIAEGELEFTMPAEVVNVTATFSNLYTVTFIPAPANGTISVNGDATGSVQIAAGAEVSLAATPSDANAYQFKSWTLSPSQTFTQGNAGSATAKFTMPAEAVTVSGEFMEKKNYSDQTLKFTYSSHSGWTISGAEDKSSYYLLKSGASIISPEIEYSQITQITVKTRTYGGSSYKTTDFYLGDATTKFGSVSATSNTLDNVSTGTDQSPLVNTPGKNTIKFSSSTTSTANGPGVSEITIKYVGLPVGGGSGEDIPGEGGATPADVTFDLTTNTSVSASSDCVTWSDNGTTMTLEKGSGTAANNYLGTSSQTRMYSGNLLTITPKSGATMKSVKITATGDSYILPTTGWTNGTASPSGSVVTVTPNDGTKAISVNPGGTKRITKVEVIYN